MDTMEHAPDILIVPSRSIDAVRPLLGVSLIERAAMTLCRYFNVRQVYVPHLDAPRTFRGITLINDFPAFNAPLVLADPLLVFDFRLARNLSSHFQAPAVACDPSTLEPIGFALLSPADIPEGFSRAPWFHVKELLSRRQNARIAVISARYFIIKHPADIAAAEQFLLKDLGRKNDDIVERNINRYLSRIVTSWTANFSINPAHISLLVMAFGLFASLLLLLTGWFENPILMLLLEIAAILSSVDGETARLKYLTSPQGRIFNYYSCRMVVWVFFTALALMHREHPFVYFSGLVFTLLYPLLVIRYDRFRHKTDIPRSFLRRLERSLRRNFSIHSVALAALTLSFLRMVEYVSMVILPLAAFGALLVLVESLSGRMERRRSA